MTWFLNIDKNDERWAWIQIFSKEECGIIIELINMEKLQKAEISQGIEDENTRISEIFWLSTDKKDREKYEWIYRRCTDAVQKINEQFFNYDLTYIETMQFTVYDKKGSFYGKHIDAEYSGSGHRKLSFSVQLSEEESYDGANLCLFNSKEPDIVSKGIGTMIIFPSWTLHEVTPLKKGKRYSLVGWVNGPRFK
jgi:PKHD-type hydroxylase